MSAIIVGSPVLRYLQHADVIPTHERQVMEESIDAMIHALATATIQSDDPPPRQAITVTHQEATGRRGRPRIEIDYDFLSFGLQLRGPTGLAPVAGVAPRTIRRRALDYALVEPAAPVYTESLDAVTGDIIRIYMSSTSGPVSAITDDELDQLMHHILEIFPTFGRRMIAGHLRQLGHRVPTLRIRESYNRVHGPPVSYSNTATGRQPYRVAGPNSLSHHDGQHGALPPFLPFLSWISKYVRPTTLAHYHSRLHRRLFALCHGHPRQRQQSCHYRLGSVLRGGGHSPRNPSSCPR